MSSKDLEDTPIAVDTKSSSLDDFEGRSRIGQEVFEGGGKTADTCLGDGKKPLVGGACPLMAFCEIDDPRPAVAPVHAQADTAAQPQLGRGTGGKLQCRKDQGKLMMIKGCIRHAVFFGAGEGLLLNYSAIHYFYFAFLKLVHFSIFSIYSTDKGCSGHLCLGYFRQSSLRIWG